MAIKKRDPFDEGFSGNNTGSKLQRRRPADSGMNRIGSGKISPRGARGAANGKPGTLSDDFLWNATSVQKLEEKAKKKK